MAVHFPVGIQARVEESQPVGRKHKSKAIGSQCIVVKDAGRSQTLARPLVLSSPALCVIARWGGRSSYPETSI